MISGETAVRDSDVKSPQPQNGPALIVRLPAELRDQFHERCKADERTAAQTVRWLIRQYLDLPEPVNGHADAYRIALRPDEKGADPFEGEFVAVQREFVDASVAVWREVDRLSTEGPYPGIPPDSELRQRERTAWERYKAVLDGPDGRGAMRWI